MLHNARTKAAQEEEVWEVDRISQPLGSPKYLFSPLFSLKHHHAAPLQPRFTKLPPALNGVSDIAQKLIGISYLNNFTETVQSIPPGLGITSMQKFKIQ